MNSAGTPDHNSVPARRRLVVVYPAGHGHYVDREFLGWIPSTETVFVVPDDGFERECRAPIRFVHADYHVWWPRRNDFGMATTSVRSLSELLDGLRPDAVVSYELHSSLTHDVSAWARGVGVPHVVLCYETALPSESCWGVFPLSRWAAQSAGRGASLVVAHTDRARASVLALGVPAAKVRRLYPGVYLPPRASESPVDGAARVRFGYLGGLRANKGLDTLLAAMDLAGGSTRDAPFDLWVAGSGPLESDLAESARRHPSVRAVGWLPEPEKRPFLQGLDALVYPSSETRFAGLLRWEEQTATAVLEGLAEGVPVVGTTSGALPEIVGEAGWIAPMDSPADLANCLVEVAADRAELRRRRPVARARAERWFEIRRAAEQLGRWLDDLAGPAARAETAHDRTV